jgi:hypothetical protein
MSSSLVGSPPGALCHPVIRFPADERLMDTVKKLGQVESDLAKSEEKFAKLKEKVAQDEANTNNHKPAISTEMQIEARWAWQDGKDGKASESAHEESERR